jgi:hypothetical protein
MVIVKQSGPAGVGVSVDRMNTSRISGRRLQHASRLASLKTWRPSCAECIHEDGFGIGPGVIVGMHVIPFYS